MDSKLSGSFQSSSGGSGGTVTAVTGVAPIASTGGNTPAISVAAATSAALGVVKPDGTIITVAAGAITVPQATNAIFGVVKVDGTTITAAAGVISAAVSNPTQTAVLAANFSKTNNTLANITGFSFALVSGVTYTFETMLIVLPSASGGSSFLTNFGAATVSGFLMTINDINQSANTINSSYTQNSALNLAQTGELQTYLKLEGSFVCTGSGTLTLQFAQQATNATASVIVAGSYMKVSQK